MVGEVAVVLGLVGVRGGGCLGVFRGALDLGVALVEAAGELREDRWVKAGGVVVVVTRVDRETQVETGVIEGFSV